MNKRKIADIGSSSNFLKIAKVAADGASLKKNAIRYYLMPSLKHLAAVKIAVALWNRTVIQDEIKKLCRKGSINCLQCKRYNEYPNLNELGQEIRNEILGIVLELSEFDAIRKILSDLVNPIGREIFDWIEYQDRHVFHNDFFDQDLAVNHLDCLVWTSRGIIDYEKTAEMLLAKNQLSLDTNSYNLACTYCLEDEAATIILNVLNRISYYILQPNYDSKTMVYFWTAQLKGDFTNLIEEVRSYNTKYETEYSMNEYIFRVLACNKKHRNNQVAIKFMWSMLSDEEKSRQILSVIKYSKTDLKCLLLSQMDAAQQQQVFKTESRTMLLCLLDDWLWKDYFISTMHHVWNVIPALDFLRVVEYIVQRRMEEHYQDVAEYNRYKAILKEVWRSAPKHLKEFTFDFQNGARGSGIIFGLLCARNLDMIQLMLPDINDVQKGTMIFSSRSNYRKCYWLIINYQIDVVKGFIDNTIFAEKDVDMFRQKLVKDYGCDIAVHFIQNQRWDEVDQFMRWVFKSHHDEREFKAKLSYSKICDDILESIVANNNEGGFIELEKFFQWCASESTQEVYRLKREMYKVYFTEVHCKLIAEDKYPLLEQVLNWCFPNDEREVESIKHCFYDDSAAIQVVQLVLNLVEKNNQLQSLEKFARWCFTKNREISRFKEWILEPGRGDTVGVCIKLLCKGMFELADHFVHWCCDSSQMKISKFKNKLMLFNGVKQLFTRYGHDDKMLENIIRWFNPSSEIFIQFNKKFEDLCWVGKLFE